MIKKILLLLLFLSNTYFFAQEFQLPFALSKDRKELFVKLPLANQKDSLLFFFDTGAGITLLDTQKAKELGLKSKDKKEITGAGGKKTYEMIRNYRLYLDRNHFIDSTAVILEDLARLYASSEKKYDGIIGITLLQHSITAFDFQKQIMTLSPPGTPINTKGYEKIPFELYQSSILQMPLTITLNTGESFTGMALFDSGASITFLMNAPYKEEKEIAKKMDQTLTYTSNNLSNTTSYEEGLIRSVQLGSFTVEDPNLILSLSSDKEGVSADTSIMGILGSEIIHRFDFILDYPNKLIYLKPNATFTQPFDANVQPLSLTYNATRDQILIANIRDRAATQKGLKKGQSILSINGITTNDIYTYEKMLQEEHKQVTIKYRDSDNNIKTVVLTLKRLL
ncbi:aspartyl protease family protein [Myroides odoratus]